MDGHINQIEEAEAYVNSVMSSQSITPVTCTEVTETNTCSNSNNSRKRQLSTEATSSTHKMSKCEDDSIVNADDVTVSSSRVDSSGNTPIPKPRSGKVMMATAEIHTSADTSVHAILQKMSADMAMMFQSLTERMDQLEST